MSTQITTGKVRFSDRNLFTPSRRSGRRYAEVQSLPLPDSEERQGHHAENQGRYGRG